MPALFEKYPQQGMTGAQSGPAQESQLMQGQRLLQMLAAYGMAGGAGIAGASGLPMVSAPLFAGGLATNINAQTPNIRDVWLDQLRMSGQQRAMDRRR
jgi:hypothetical protein